MASRCLTPAMGLSLQWQMEIVSYSPGSALIQHHDLKFEHRKHLWLEGHSVCKSACLRRCVVRHESPLLTDGAYILHHADHFVAARYLDGSLEVNFGHRTHTWEAACVCNQADTDVAWWRDGARWQLNLPHLAVFFISDHHTVHGNDCDCAAGSSPASTECPHIPSFLDSELSDSHSAVSDRGLGPARGSWIPIEEAQRRIRIFEGFLCDYKLLLVHQPSLFATIPSPFVDEEERAWDVAVADRRASLSLLQSAVGDALSSIRMEDQRKAFKRMRLYVSLLRTFIDPIRKRPESLSALPNPCDSTITKRVWESAIYQQRKSWCSDGADAVGGAQLDICSAVTGEVLVAVPMTLDEALVPCVRKAVAAISSTPYFAIDVILNYEILVDELHSWDDCHCPDQVSVVKRPRTLEWTQDLFEAIDSGAEEDLRRCLLLGQDPDCVLRHSALTHAVSQGNETAVRILLQGGASLNLIPPGQLQAPLHGAAVGSSPAILQLLLDAKCHPNAPDLQGIYPLHHASRKDSQCQAELVAILLRSGADVMQRDPDGDTAFSVACTSRILALCMDQGWERLTMLDVWQRHIEALVQYVSNPSLFTTCSAMHKQMCFFVHGDVAGGSGSVIFTLACTGQDICSLPLEDEDDETILALKQHVARKLQHLPFAVILLANSTVVPLSSSWSAIGSPEVLEVVLTNRTTHFASQLSTAVRQQDHDTLIAILEKGQEPNCWRYSSITRRSEPPLLTAAGQGFFYSTYLLINAFADPNIPANGRTALHLAVLARSPTTLQVLLDHGAETQALDLHGETPLHYAALLEEVQLVNQLVRAGADALAPDTEGEMPLLWAGQAETRAELMDGCWAQISFLHLLLLNAPTLSKLTGRKVLARLCRGTHRALQELSIYHLRDALGGSTLCNNREAARARKMRKTVVWTQSGMELPVRGDGADALIPFNYEYFAACQDINTLAWLHPHLRDRNVRFWGKRPCVLCQWEKDQGVGDWLDSSICQQIWCRTRPLLPWLEVIGGHVQAMCGHAWTTPHWSWFGVLILSFYLRSLIARATSLGYVTGSSASRTNFQTWMQSLTLNPHEIKCVWEANRIAAALSGTYMHYLFEAHVNGYRVPQTSPEFFMLQGFLQSMHGWRAFRTEWIIYGEEENIAGSIDLSAINGNGELALIDWKRTSSLSSKFTSHNNMRPPLSHLPDCAGIHYRLQLNAYRYIIEKYYGYKVSMMLVVCTHPDRELQPFVDEVPRLEAEVEGMMRVWRNDEFGGATRSTSQRPCQEEIEAEAEMIPWTQSGSMEFVEEYCVFTVCQILVVSAHPNKPLQPLVYEVPSLEKEVEATMRIWTGREPGGSFKTKFCRVVKKLKF